MISFDNTEIAFKSKSNKQLNKAYWLFKMVGSPAMVKMGKVATDVALKLHLPINGIVKATIFQQFCGGENIKECTPTINELGKFGVGTILDYSVEGKTSDEDFENTTQEIIETIKRGENDPFIPFAVFKVTGISRFGLLEKANPENAVLTDSEQKEYADLVERVERICREGFERNVPVFIDAEETWIQDVIDRLAYDMMLKFNQQKPIIYNTVQMYRHDRLAHLKAVVAQAKLDGIYYGVKLVRGAYMEKERNRAKQMGYPSPIQPNKEAADRDYNLALDFIFENVERIGLCAGTHNEYSAKYVSELIQKFNVDLNNPNVYVAQLLGMSDHISFNLAAAGVNVAKYVPYGPVKEVIPYLIRRAEENTSVAGQTGRELGLIMKERNRRKMK